MWLDGTTSITSVKCRPSNPLNEPNAFDNESIESLYMCSSYL